VLTGTITGSLLFAQSYFYREGVKTDMKALKSGLETKISSVDVNLSKKIDGIGGKEDVDLLKAESQKQAT
jgi:hypothetical protein